MNKLFSKTVAALLSITCMSSVITASFNGKTIFTPKLVADAEDNTSDESKGLYFDASTGKLTLSGEINTEDLLEYTNKDKVKSIEAEKGTVLKPKSGGIFSGFKAETIDLSNVNTSQIYDMSLMFSNCSNLKSINLSGLDTKNVSSMNLMFNGCSSLESLDLSGFDTKNVISMYHMFEGCSSLESLDLCNFDTQNVETMSCMFHDCKKLKYLNVSSFDTKKVEDMSGMFANCSNLSKIELNNFNTENVTKTNHMFANCTGFKDVLDICSFDTKNVTQMNFMFAGCSNLKTINVSEKWSTDSLLYAPDEVFLDCDSLVGGNGTNYDPSRTGYEMACIDTSQTPGYLTYKEYTPPHFKKYTACITEKTNIYIFNGETEIPNTTSNKTIEANSKVIIYEEKNGKGRISPDGKTPSSWVDLSKVSASVDAKSNNNGSNTTNKDDSKPTNNNSSQDNTQSSNNNDSNSTSKDNTSPSNQSQTPLQYTNPTYIYDKNLNDDGLPYGRLPEITEPDQPTDGVLQIEGNTTKYVFKRYTNTESSFVISPQKSSIYKISIKGIDGTQDDFFNPIIKIENEFWEEPIEPNENGEYFLPASKYKYIITTAVNSNTYTMYEISIQQSNWEYASNGGIAFNPALFYQGNHLINYTRFYMTEDIISEIWPGCKGYQVHDDKFKNEFVNAMTNIFFGDVDTSENIIHKISSSVSNGIGLVVLGSDLNLITISSGAAKFLTLAGGAALLISLLSINRDANEVEAFKNKLEYVISDGNCNLCLICYQPENTNHTIIDVEKWDNEYISKVYNLDRLEVTSEISITSFEKDELIKDSDSEKATTSSTSTTKVVTTTIHTSSTTTSAGTTKASSSMTTTSTTAKTTTVPVTTSSKSATTKELGDVDGNGMLDAVDASKMMANYAKYSTGTAIPTEDELAVCDVNKDGYIDAVDASKVLAFYAHTSTGGELSFKEFMKNK